jgi:hypothetical protein
MTKGQIAQTLLDYCLRKDQMGLLVSALNREIPTSSVIIDRNDNNEDEAKDEDEESEEAEYFDNGNSLNDEKGIVVLKFEHFRIRLKSPDGYIILVSVFAALVIGPFLSIIFIMISAMAFNYASPSIIGATMLCILLYGLFKSFVIIEDVQSNS